MEACQIAQYSAFNFVLQLRKVTLFILMRKQHETLSGIGAFQQKLFIFSGNVMLIERNVKRECRAENEVSPPGPARACVVSTLSDRPRVDSLELEQFIRH